MPTGVAAAVPDPMPCPGQAPLPPMTG